MCGFSLCCVVVRFASAIAVIRPVIEISSAVNLRVGCIVITCVFIGI